MWMSAKKASEKPVRAKGTPKAARSTRPPAKKVAARAVTENATLGDWRGHVLRHVRKLILEADPEITEEVKWRKPSNPAGVPVWSHNGIVCTGESYKAVVKVTFAKGASLPDPASLFNASLDGNVRRAIDIHEGDTIDEAALKDLFREAVSLNLSETK
jgi:hypothetical protein